MRGDEVSVLLVDDRVENLLALEAVLEPLGCRMVSVGSGDEALKAMLQDDFAVVLLDVQMPGLDGFETAELIKRRERTRTVPIIFVTAISKERTHVFRGYEAGAVDYVFKPYEPEVLRAKVGVFLELEAKSRAAARSEAVLAAAFDSAPIGMARIDAEGRITECNAALAELLQRDRADLRDRLLDSLLHIDDVESDRDRRSALLDGALRRYESEARLLTPDGDEIPCSMSFALAKPRGLPASMLVQVQDLRERRRAQEEREQLVREQAARAEAEAVSERLAAVQLISDASLRAEAVGPLVEELLARVVDVLGVDTAAIVLPAEGNGLVAYQAAAAGGAGVQRRPWEPDGEEDHPLGDAVSSVFRSPLGDPRSAGELIVGSLFPRRFSAGDEALLRLAAARAGQAIGRVRLFEREHAIAEQLQRSLLPEGLPETPAIASAARYLPAGAGSQVGGDWYDLLVQPSGALLAVIGDVAGRGVGAAATMGQLRSAVRAYAFDGHSPASLLERLNAFQVGLRPRGMATVLLASVDPAAQTVTFARAGHPPPLIIAPDGSSEYAWGKGGVVLGAMPVATYEEYTRPLPVGSALVLYTDGLVEHRGEVLDLGLARLSEAAASGPRRLDPLADHLVEQTVVDPDVEDDITLLLLRAMAVETLDPGPGAAWDIAGGPEAPSVARLHAREHLAGVLSAKRLQDVALALSELVANACVHGGADHAEPVRVRIHEKGRKVRIAVSDPARGSSEPAVQPVDVNRPGGMGLRIVEAVSDDWGYDGTDPRIVWFEVAR